MNEEDRLEACLRSADFADEWIVVDSHSSDRTREIAAACGARVVERDWPGHVEQKNFALSLSSNDWVLCLDADGRVERLPERIAFAAHRRALEEYAKRVRKLNA